MRIKVKDENKTIGFALPNMFLLGSLGANLITREINKSNAKKGIPTRISARDMRKIFRMLRRARRKGKPILELEVGEDVKIVI